MSAAATWRGLGRALLAGLGGPSLGLVMQGHVPAATAWPARSTGGRAAVAAPVHSPQHRVAANAGALDAGYAGGQP
jgi:hypothetical protein